MPSLRGRDPFTDTLSDISATARFPNLAKINANVAVDYAFEPMKVGVVDVRLSYAYRSKIYFFVNDMVSPFNQATASPATNSVDARLSLADIPLGGRAKGEIALVGENLLNEDQIQFGIDFGPLGFAGQTHSIGRRAAIQLRVTY